MSRHGGGANFGMCDASVHFVNDNIDVYVYQCLATIAGNESFTTPADLSVHSVPQPVLLPP